MPYHKKSTAQFVTEAQSVHGNKYDYYSGCRNQRTLSLWNSLKERER